MAAMDGKARAAELLRVLNLQKIEENLYLGDNETHHFNRLFGGQVLAQAAQAAYQTVEGVVLHSAHAYFLRAGVPQHPVLYEIERIRDGRSFVTRRVVAIQKGEAIFSMDVSFQIEEIGFEHAQPMPNVPLAEELEDDVDRSNTHLSDLDGVSKLATTPRPFETRSVFPIASEASEHDRFWSPTWIRFCGEHNGEDSLARVLLAYASDIRMVSTASLPHQSTVGLDDLQMASLDHALWIHRPVPITQWLLVHKRTSTAHGSRGLVHADIFSTAGELVASITQEGLIRQVASS